MKDRIRELATKAAKGNKNAASELMDLALNKFPGAREALLQAWESVQKVTRDTDDGAADREEFWSDLPSIVGAVDRDPATGATPDTLKDMRTRAEALGTCETVQVIGLEAYQLRRLGHLETAQELLDDAWRLGASCRVKRHGLTACRLDIGRRRTVLLQSMGDFPQALVTIEESLEGYRRFGGPGHDLDGDGIATCLAERGKILYMMGDPHAAARDLSVCLERLPTGSAFYGQIRQDLAVALADTGPEGKAEAYQFLQKHRLAYRFRPRSVDRALFFWFDGQLEIERRGRLGRNRYRGRKKIRIAIDDFAGLGVPDPYLAATSDLLKSFRNNREAIDRYLTENLPVAKGLIHSPVHYRRLEMILEESRGMPSPDTWSRLEQWIRELREGLSSPMVLPCLIS